MIRCKNDDTSLKDGITDTMSYFRQHDQKLCWIE